MTGPTIAELSPAVAEPIVALWLFALGGSIGSFLNVVVYRLPAGKSLIVPGSHCPACTHPIRWYDNVPVLGWFVLRGRCRDCGGPISFRYPLVEGTTAALFAVVGVVEGLSGGANLPLPAPSTVSGELLPALDLAESGAMVAYHLVLLSTLLAGALIEYDGHRAPGRLFGPVLAVGWLAPIAWPVLHPVPAWPGLHGTAGAIVTATVGLAWGLLLGLAVGRLLRSPGCGLSLAAASAGAVLGWQAASVLAGATVLAHAAAGAARKLSLGNKAMPPLAFLGLSATVWILFWGEIVERWPVLG